MPGERGLIDSDMPISLNRSRYPNFVNSSNILNPPYTMNPMNIMKLSNPTSKSLDLIGYVPWLIEHKFNFS